MRITFDGSEMSCKEKKQFTANGHPKYDKAASITRSGRSRKFERASMEGRERRAVMMKGSPERIS